MTITKTLTIVAIHGELEPTEDADHNPRDCDVVILAKDVDGNAAEIHVADWTEAAQLKGATEITISIETVAQAAPAAETITAADVGKVSASDLAGK